MSVKDTMVRFRYLFNKFNEQMKDYEAIAEQSAKARLQQHLAKKNGEMDKWSKFIEQNDISADTKMNEAEESFKGLLDIFSMKTPKPVAKKKTKA